MGKTDLCKQLLVGCIIAALSMSTAKSLAAADVMVGVDVPADKQVPHNRIEHSAWDSLLKKYVDERGMVQYTA